MIELLMAFAMHTSDIEEIWTPNIEEEVKSLEMEATFYTAHCEGCIGIVKSGYDVRDNIYYEGKRILATDSDIPLYTEFLVELENGYKFEAIVLDRGGAIKGKKIDVLVSTTEEALLLGRQKAKLFKR